MNKYLRFYSQLSESQLNLMKKGLPKKKHIEGVAKIVLVSSAKGGVGKSTIATNLAIALMEKSPNKSIGLLDADIFGPSQPQLFNLHDIQPEVDIKNKMIPLINYGVKVMSMGFLVDKQAAVAWRGLMVMAAIEKLLFQVNWGSIDCLVIDMPPGTGDVQLSICQRLFIDGSILVTTPQQLAMVDMKRGWKMFLKMEIPILGYVQNMSYFTCANCQQRHEPFGKCDVLDESIEMLAEFPFEDRLSIENDVGQPICVGGVPTAAIVGEYRRLADAVWHRIL